MEEVQEGEVIVNKVCVAYEDHWGRPLSFNLRVLISSTFYTCDYTGSVEHCNHIWTHIHTDAPVVTTTLSSPQRIPRGNTLTLFCDYESVPPPDITWFFNSSPLSSVDPGITTTELRSELMLGPLEEGEGGTYTCSASNIVGGSSRDIEVIVQGERTHAYFHCMCV